MPEQSETTLFIFGGYMKIFMAFIIMGMAFTLDKWWMRAIQYVAGAIYFCFGLKHVLDERRP